MWLEIVIDSNFPPEENLQIKNKSKVSFIRRFHCINVGKGSKKLNALPAHKYGFVSEQIRSYFETEVKIKHPRQ